MLGNEINLNLNLYYELITYTKLMKICYPNLKNPGFQTLAHVINLDTYFILKIYHAQQYANKILYQNPKESRFFYRVINLNSVSKLCIIHIENIIGSGFPALAHVSNLNFKFHIA